MRAVFLDRDGTVTKATRLVTKQEEIELVDGAAEGIKRINELGLKVIIVTNQPQIARGLCSEKDVEEINSFMIEKLAEKGATIDAVYFCPHHPEKHHRDIPQHATKYRITCECRKPGTGMLKKAAKELGIDLSKSFMIGDRAVDIMAGKSAGCRTILVKTGSGGRDEKHDVKADYISENLEVAAGIIREFTPMIKAVILAGGRGERLRPITENVPKPMISIAGKPALEHHIELLKKHGITDIVICASYMSDKIKDYFRKGKGLGVSISYPEEPEQLGTGGAIKNAAGFLKDADHFIVLNGDVMMNIDLGTLIDRHLKTNPLATVVVRNSDHPKDSDVVKMNGDRIIEYVGRGQEEHRIANAGIMVLGKRILDYIPQGISNIEKDVVFKLVDKEKICGFLSDAYIKDFGTPERLESVRKRFGSVS